MINTLHTGSERVIIDGNLNPKHFAKHGLRADLGHVQSVVKADGKFPSVMAASIIAKNYRDNLMLECHKTFPQYGFDKHVGYITAGHLAAVKQYGLTCLHRRSYKVKLD